MTGSPERTQQLLKVLLPLALIVVGVIAARALVLSREAPETRIPDVPVPLVRVETVRLQDLQLTVTSQGTVSPRTESVLIPEVSGRVIEVAPSFASGGFFEANELLLRIDAQDYEQAVAQARAAVAQAELRLERERAEAEVARREWSELGEGEAPPLTRRDLQIADAEAALDSSRSALEQAERNRDRTAIRAPYPGRIRSKSVDLGQFVTRGTPLATIYAVDYAEIRLPLPDDELAFVELPSVYRGERNRTGPEVILRARFAGGEHRWTGRIVRTEGEIDPRSRMVHTVARVKDPYQRGDGSRPPLAAGMYVEAEILGHRVEGVAVIPRSALRAGDQVLVIDEQDRLRFRDVGILRRTATDLIVESGLAEGERVCMSPLAAVTDGMQVRTLDEEPAQDG